MPTIARGGESVFSARAFSESTRGRGLRRACRLHGYQYRQRFGHRSRHHCYSRCPRPIACSSGVSVEHGSKNIHSMKGELLHPRPRGGGPRCSPSGNKSSINSMSGESARTAVTTLTCFMAGSPGSKEAIDAPLRANALLARLVASMRRPQSDRGAQNEAAFGQEQKLAVAHVGDRRPRKAAGHLFLGPLSLRRGGLRRVKRKKGPSHRGHFFILGGVFLGASGSGVLKSGELRSVPLNGQPANSVQQAPAPIFTEESW